MTLNKCFTTVFDPAMKELGFMRKGVLYYRMNGEILQGIVCKTTNPFQVCYAYFPYWAYGFRRERYDLKSGYWAEIGQCLMGGYCKKNDDEENLKKMQTCLQFVCDTIVPELNNISDTVQYLQQLELNEEKWFHKATDETENARVKNYVEISGDIMGSQTLSQQVLLKKAYDDRSFEDTNRLLDKIFFFDAEMIRFRAAQKNKSWEKNVKDHMEILLEITPDMGQEAAYREAYRVWGPKDDDAIEAEIEKRKASHIAANYAEYYARMEANDLDWIKPIYDAECEKMRVMLKDELKLQI